MYFFAVHVTLALVLCFVTNSHATGKSWHACMTTRSTEEGLLFVSFRAATLTPSTLVVCPSAASMLPTVTCTTDTGALLWRLGNNQSFFDSTHAVGEIKKLEYFDTQFNTSLDSVEGMNYYTSTATIVSSLPNNITNITKVNQKSFNKKT